MSAFAVVDEFGNFIVAAPLSQRTKVFISYSRRDAQWLPRLRVHLKPLEREGIEIWDDTMIDAGDQWKEEIEHALATAKVAVLLISADFLASDFIATDELPPLLNAAKEQGATVLPLILSPSRFSKHPTLFKFQAINDPARPLLSMSSSEQEEVLVRLSEAIDAAFTGISPHPPPQLFDTPRVAGTIASEHHSKRNRRIHPAILVVAGLMLVLSTVIGLWLFVTRQKDYSNVYQGQVFNDRGKGVSGASVEIQDERGNRQTRTTGTTGTFVYTLPPLSKLAHFVITAPGYARFEKDMAPDETSRGPIILSDSTPTPTPTPPPTPKTSPKPRPKETPCTAEDKLFKRC